MSALVARLWKVIVLPPEISRFEREYLAKVNRLAMQFFWLHVPAFTLIAWVHDNRAALAFVLTSAVALGPWVAHRSLSNPRTVSLVHGFAAMLMGGLLVHFGQGPVQIEMHFYFFALLAMLALFGNPLAIVVAAVTVALHHLLLWFLLPSSVFNYAAPWWVVAVHAGFVVLESIATIYIARSFFDNVIGLEKIVQKRTVELDARNGAMRLVLDNVEEALVTIDRAGRVLSEHSAAVTRMFGTPEPGRPLRDFLARLDPDFAEEFALAWEQCLEDVLPLELCIAQAPSKLTHDGRRYRFAYRPLLDEAQAVAGMLVIVSDVTAECERQRLELEQRETLAALDRILDDKAGFLEFLAEADELLGTIADPPPNGLVVVKRALHTLKGNCMTYGVGTIADLCHRLESTLLSEKRAPTPVEVAELSGAWRSLKGRLSALLGEQARTRIEIEPERLHDLLGAALDKRPHADLARMIAELRLEPTAGRLRRVGDNARRIAKRLEKGNVAVRVDDSELFLDAERWSSFWSAFTHVVRNALDHGIETLDVRERAGKVGEGCLQLRTFVQGSDFVIAIEDDGRGIAWERVRERARNAGLPHASRADLIEALFVDGISTADEVTEFSGRGVGLAVMRAACEERGGRIEVESEPGRGTSFVFRFPRKSMSPSPEEYFVAAACAGEENGRAA